MSRRFSVPGLHAGRGTGKADIISSEIKEKFGFINCGGCPGKKSVLPARELVKRGADTLVFASCIQKGNPIGYPCPFAAKMKALIRKEFPENIKLLDYTH